MGLGLIGAMAGAAEGIAGTANTYYRADLEEQKQQALQDAMMERQKRMAEFNAELQVKARQKDADFKAAEAGKVTARAQELADQRGGGLIQSANTAYDSMASTDPQGAALGKQAVADAQERGAYNQNITAKDRMMALAERDPAAIRDLANMENTEERNVREDRRIALMEDRQATLEKAAADKNAVENRRIDAMIARGDAPKSTNDAKALKSFMDENKALWMHTDPMSGKPVENVYVSSFLRQAYSRGDADSVNAVVNRARQAAIDQKTGQLDDEKFASNMAKLAKAGLGRYSQPEPVEPEEKKAGTRQQGDTQRRVADDTPPRMSDGKRLIGAAGMAKLRKQIEDARVRVSYLKDTDARSQDILAAENELSRLENELLNSAANEYVSNN